MVVVMMRKMILAGRPGAWRWRAVYTLQQHVMSKFWIISLISFEFLKYANTDSDTSNALHVRDGHIKYALSEK